MNLRQQQTNITDYYNKFTDMKNLVDEMVVDYFMGGIIDIICCEKGDDRKSITPDKEVEYMMTGQERMLAMQFIMNSDWERYGDVIEKYDQEYLAGCNKYPTTLHGTYILLKNWSQKPAKKGPGFNPWRQ